MKKIAFTLLLVSGGIFAANSNTPKKNWRDTFLHNTMLQKALKKEFEKNGKLEASAVVAYLDMVATQESLSSAQHELSALSLLKREYNSASKKITGEGLTVAREVEQWETEHADADEPTRNAFYTEKADKLHALAKGDNPFTQELHKYYITMLNLALQRAHTWKVQHSDTDGVNIEEFDMAIIERVRVLAQKDALLMQRLARFNEVLQMVGEGKTLRDDTDANPAAAASATKE